MFYSHNFCWLYFLEVSCQDVRIQKLHSSLTDRSDEMITDLETNRETNTALSVLLLCQEVGCLKWVYKLGWVHLTEACFLYLNIKKKNTWRMLFNSLGF